VETSFSFGAAQGYESGDPMGSFDEKRDKTHYTVPLKSKRKLCAKETSSDHLKE
jgi:hypothetical protein